MDTISQSTRAERIARSRGTVYCALARALSPPNEVLCRAALDGSLLAAIEEALAPSPAHRGCLDASWAWNLTSDAGPETWTDAIAVEHTRLFSSGLICPHYEADYVAAESFRAMHVIAEVAAVYATFGVKVSPGAAERPDHIAIELEFMGWLAGKEAHACAQGQAGNARICRGAQRVFFEKHLGCWGRAAANTLHEAATAPFYRATASLLGAFLAAEAGYLRIDLDHIERRHESRGPPPAGATEGAAKACGGCSACST